MHIRLLRLLLWIDCLAIYININLLHTGYCDVMVASEIEVVREILEKCSVVMLEVLCGLTRHP